MKQKHKHFYKIKGALVHRGKTWTTMKCDCGEFYHVERGWFQFAGNGWPVVARKS